MYEKELAAVSNNPQVAKLSLVMDIVTDHFKDHSDYVKSKVEKSLARFTKKVIETYNTNDPKTTFYHQTLIDMFYNSMDLDPCNQLRKDGNVVYFVDFVGMFNVSIYERAIYYSEYRVICSPSETKPVLLRDHKIETITDLFGKEIGKFRRTPSCLGAHIFKYKQDCDIFCYFVRILNDNLLGFGR